MKLARPPLRDLHSTQLRAMYLLHLPFFRRSPPFCRSRLHPSHIVRTSSTYTHILFVEQDLKIRMAALEAQVAKIQALAPSAASPPLFKSHVPCAAPCAVAPSRPSSGHPGAS